MLSMRSTPVKRPTASKRANSMSTRSAAKPVNDWNTYLTDDVYKATPEDILKKKQMHLSKHNILQDVARPSSSTKPSKNKSSKKKLSPCRMDDSIIEELEASDKHIADALELIDDYHEDQLDSFVPESMYYLPNSSKTAQSSRPSFNGYKVENTKKITVMHTRENNIKPTPIKSLKVNIHGTPIMQHSSNILSTSEHLDGELDDDMEDIVAQITMLVEEMKYYEELSGRKNIFNFEDMKSELIRDVKSSAINPNDENTSTSSLVTSHFIEVSPSGKKTLNQKRLMRYLVSLVCKSMTYLLQSEVKLQQQASQYTRLEGTVNELISQMKNKPAAFLELSPALGEPMNHSAKVDISKQSAGMGKNDTEDDAYSRMWSYYENYSQSPKEDQTTKTMLPPPPPPSQQQSVLGGENTAAKLFAPRVTMVNSMNHTATTAASVNKTAVNVSHRVPHVMIPSAVATPVTPPRDSSSYQHPASVPMPGTSTTDWLFASHTMKKDASQIDKGVYQYESPVKSSGVTAVTASPVHVAGRSTLNESLNRTVDLYTSRSQRQSLSEALFTVSDDVQNMHGHKHSAKHLHWNDQADVHDDASDVEHEEYTDRLMYNADGIDTGLQYM